MRKICKYWPIFWDDILCKKIISGSTHVKLSMFRLNQLGRTYTKLISVFTFRWWNFRMTFLSFNFVGLFFFLQWTFITVTIWKSREIFLSWTKERFYLPTNILSSLWLSMIVVPATCLGLCHHPSCYGPSVSITSLLKHQKSISWDK